MGNVGDDLQKDNKHVLFAFEEAIGLCFKVFFVFFWQKREKERQKFDLNRNLISKTDLCKKITR